MSSYPVKRAERTPRKVGKSGGDAVEPTVTANPFSSFSYSYMEISVGAGKARVKAKKASFEAGKLASESFEGDLDRSAYEQMVGHAQHHVLGQATLFLKSLALLLPFASGRQRGRD